MVERTAQPNANAGRIFVDVLKAAEVVDFSGKLMVVIDARAYK